MSRSLLGLIGVLAGCSSGGQGAVSGGDGGPDAAAVDATAPEVFRRDVTFVYPEAAPPPDFGPLPAALPLPAGVTPPQRLLGPDDHLAGDGFTSCSDPPPGSGDRWCVFHRPPAELWIIDASKAAAGAVPRCDGSSPDCRRLTSTLWTGSSVGGPSHPYSHQFNGETLIFYADSSAGPRDLYQGPVYAWRPGWTEPRVLTSPRGVMCFGHPHRPLVHCVDAAEGDPSKPDSFELRAGSIAQPPATPLPSLGRLRPFRTGGEVAWEAAFSPDGTTFAVSSPDPDPAVEILRVVATADIGRQPPRELIRDATNWTIGNDGRRIYFFRPTAPDLNRLYAADFATGAGEILLSDNVRDYLVPGESDQDQGVTFLSASGGDHGAFRFIRDSTMPEAAITVFSYRDVLEDLNMSADLRYTVWLDAGFNARVVRHSDLSSCRLNIYAGGAAFQPMLTDSAGLVFWSEDVPRSDNVRELFYGRPDDCQGKQRLATGVGFYFPIGDRALLYTDESDPTTRANLAYAAVRSTAAGWVVEAPVRVHQGLEYGQFTIAGWPPALALFRTAGPDGGTWVFALPF
jgi:hypothetical protein